MNAAADTADADRDRLRALLLATAGGDRSAFEDLYSRTSAKLFGICVRILNERTQAEEALQDVYMAIWQKAGMYDGERASPITWLAMIARNKSIDYLRSGKSDRLSQPLDLAAELQDDDASVSELAAAHVDNRRLHGCLDQLDDNQRKVIHTAFFEGCTYDEIAIRSETPLGTVKSWVRRGLIKLKACLQG
ncbi:sigma-70 family RNA polymerase sigma factor [Luteimonas vadosa]|uniref:Sigma-70 family RNA polymerase sigma factor n=1 Tax=Luteimonas vadosa TaxID=1165507 RepID=A0ABP9E2L9_9GAMM